MGVLQEFSATVQVYDPQAMKEAQRIYGSRNDLSLCGTKVAALKGADALVIDTEWQEFCAPDFDFIKKALRESSIFDGRNMYEPKRAVRMGLSYYSVGRSQQS